MQITEQDKLSFLAIINDHNFFLNIENQDSTSSQAPEPLHFSYIPHKILSQVAWKGGERQPPRPLKTNYNCCPIASLQHHLQIIKHQCKPYIASIVSPNNTSCHIYLTSVTQDSKNQYL